MKNPEERTSMYHQSKNQILLINDLAGYGKVALSAMIPILSHMGFELFTLPTALVSNTLDYGRFEILDTRNYIENTLAVWEELGFSFGAISTGFIASDEEAEILAAFCARQKTRGTPVFVDPIMGDNGSLYHGISESAIVNRRRLIDGADLVKPNYTEACLLTGISYQAEGISEEEGEELVESVRRLGADSVLITSVPMNEGMCCLGYDVEQKEYFCLPYEEIDVRFPGTGDIFFSILIGKSMQKENLKQAAHKTMQVISRMIAENVQNADKYRGIPVEQYLHLL